MPTTKKSRSIAATAAQLVATGLSAARAVEPPTRLRALKNAASVIPTEMAGPAKSATENAADGSAPARRMRALAIVTAISKNVRTRAPTVPTHHLPPMQRTQALTIAKS